VEAAVLESRSKQSSRLNLERKEIRSAYAATKDLQKENPTDDGDLRVIGHPAAV